jgi:uracil-DNA glycosylase
VSTDEIFERYLQKAITEINELGDEIAHAAGESHVPVVGSGHPLADIFLLKYGPQASEAQEGVSFYGRAGQAIIKSLQRLNVDPLAVYGRTASSRWPESPSRRARCSRASCTSFSRS